MQFSTGNGMLPNGNGKHSIVNYGLGSGQTHLNYTARYNQVCGERGTGCTVQGERGTGSTVKGCLTEKRNTPVVHSLYRAPFHTRVSKPALLVLASPPCSC